MTKIIQSGRFLSNMMGNLSKKALMNFAVPVATNVLPKLGKATSYVLAKLKKIIISKQGAVRAGKGLTFFVSNEIMDDIIEIVKSLEDPSLLIGGASDILKHEIKKNKNCEFLRAMIAPYYFFINLASDFLLDKCYNWKRRYDNRKSTRRWISSCF